MNRYLGGAPVAGALVLVGCGGGGEETVGADVVVIDRRIQALTASQIDFVDGTYGVDCTSRSGSWSLRVAGQPMLTNPALSVIKGDAFADCKLEITDIHTTGDGLLAADAPITLDVTYGQARAFTIPGMSDVLFYANAALGAANFDGPLAITLLFSDDPRIATGSTTATYAQVSATVGTSNVAAPNYGLNLSGVTVTTDLQKRVASVSGDVALTAMSQTGEFYALVIGAVGDTYAEIDAAYGAATKVAIALMIPASGLLALNLDITSPVVRSIIIAHTQDGVRTYQKFAITFNPPA